MNGDILNKIDKKIEKTLEDKRLGKATRSALEVQSLFITFLKQSQEDHIKITKLWDERLITLWIVRLAGASVIGIALGHFFGIAPISIG